MISQNAPFAVHLVKGETLNRASPTSRWMLPYCLTGGTCDCDNVLHTHVFPFAGREVGC